jgi:hypothetical protein
MSVEVHAAMSSDVAIDVTASAINVTIPEELREPRRRTVTPV